jgi:hypothetical protein
LKAIEEGVTVLDAFAVKSAKHPDGFLPDTYSKFGFETLGYVKFDESYYSNIELADIKKFWTDSGWNEADGYPDIAIMKWRGSDEARLNATNKFDQSSPEGFDAGPASGITSSSTRVDGSGVKQPAQESVGGRTDIGNDTGPVRDGNGTGGSSRAHSAVREALGLTDKELDNLGVSRAEMDEIKDILGVRYSMADGKAEAAINPETGELHINAAAIRDTDHLMAVLREEVVGHYGLRKTLGAEFQGVINDIKASAATNSELRAIWTDLSGIDPVTKEVINPNAPYKGMADDVIADEIISKMARNEIPNTLWLQVKGIIIKALRKIGLVKDDITVTEMKSLVAKSAKALKKQASKPPTITGIKPNIKGTMDDSDTEAMDAEAARAMNDETVDGIVFDENGAATSYRQTLIESDNDIKAIEQLKVCML